VHQKVAGWIHAVVGQENTDASTAVDGNQPTGILVTSNRILGWKPENKKKFRFHLSRVAERLCFARIWPLRWNRAIPTS
jgi:hypothetical protein